MNLPPQPPRVRELVSILQPLRIAEHHLEHDRAALERLLWPLLHQALADHDVARAESLVANCPCAVVSGRARLLIHRARDGECFTWVAGGDLLRYQQECGGLRNSLASLNQFRSSIEALALRMIRREFEQYGERAARALAGQVASPSLTQLTERLLDRAGASLACEPALV